VKDIAELAGITRNAVGAAKAYGKIDPGDFSADGKEREKRQEPSPCLVEEAQKESSPQIETPF